MTISEVASMLTALASVGTLVFAVVIWLQGRQIKQRGETTHDLVNSMSEDRLQTAKDQSYSAGRTEGRLNRLEKTNGIKAEDQPKGG